MTMMPIQMPRKTVFYQFSTKEMMLGTMWLPLLERKVKRRTTQEISHFPILEKMLQSLVVFYMASLIELGVQPSQLEFS